MKDFHFTVYLAMEDEFHPLAVKHATIKAKNQEQAWERAEFEAKVEAKALGCSSWLHCDEDEAEVRCFFNSKTRKRGAKV